MRELALTEGYTASAIEGVRLMRANRPLPRAPVLYEPSIVVVCQGTKRGFLHGHSFTYDPLHYLVLSAPLPFEAQTFASAAEPLLAISMRIDLTVAAELALALGDPGRGAPQPQGICAAPLDDRLGDAVLRLLQASQCPVEATVMGPVILREIYFRVLTGENGNAIRAALAHHSHFSKINKALRIIHAQFSEELSVSALANEAGMSLAAFHASFKAVTATSPIQYLKATRLHRARLLMVQDGLNASVAAGRVGYESASQFSREFKRFFGRSPVEEATHMSQLVAVMPGLQGGAQRLPMPTPQRYVIVD
ncbi:AraC family transcriptional regulator [Cupriavidus sp. CV2]|uniref:AraC family transcriptional regulator n=1 Tax=Cupriavidus ulmosensis TaxID=3065913 RepID=UPI00296AC29E|nr:AraC family transcriptional regulator [Cupriavidus sp. CV2]MDW3686261.1 AraC family transcriptional regulator [Cupriavidus sp. CV2]